MTDDEGPIIYNNQDLNFNIDNDNAITYNIEKPKKQ